MPNADIFKYSGFFPAIDGHVDLLHFMMRQARGIPFGDLSEGVITPQTLIKGDVRVIVSAIYCSDSYNGPQTAASHLQHLLAHAQRNHQGLASIYSASDLQKSFCTKSETGVLLLLENADSLVDIEPGEMQEQGFVVVGLTHAGKNRLGDGNGVKNPQGFSAAGRRVVKELERLRFVIDVAHLSEPCFWDLIDQFSGPLICSHTGLRKFHDVPRNLSEKQLEVLLARHSVVGISFAPEMLSNRRNVGIEDFFRQIDWFVQRFGSDQIGLGSDFGGFEGTTRGLEDHGGLVKLIEMFLSHGYSVEDIGKIVGENWYRFYLDCLP